LVFCTRSCQVFLSLTSSIQFLSFSFFKSFITSSHHLFLGGPSVLIPMGFQSVIFLTSLISSILLRNPRHFTLLCFIYLSASCPLIKFYDSLLLLILHPSLHSLVHIFFLQFVFQKPINYF